MVLPHSRLLLADIHRIDVDMCKKLIRRFDFPFGTTLQCFHLVKDVNIDLLKAVFFHRKAVASDYPSSMDLYAHLPEKGDEMVKDESCKVKLYARAARLSYVPAQNAVTECDCYGRELETPPLRTFIMLQGAVNAKDHEAMFPLGDCYHNGVGVERNDHVA